MSTAPEYVPIASLVVAALAVVVGPWVSWRVAKAASETSARIANQQVVAPMRQAWINTLRDRIAEILSTSHWYHVSGMSDSHEPADDPGEDPAFREVDRKLLFLRRQVELMLNPHEEDHRRLVESLDEVVRAGLGHGEAAMGIGGKFETATVLAQSVLKREWQRVKQGAED